MEVNEVLQRYLNMELLKTKDRVQHDVSEISQLLLCWCRIFLCQPDQSHGIVEIYISISIEVEQLPIFLDYLA